MSEQRHRVLDLTDERGQLAGLVLAMLGADVVLVEPPGGSAVRSTGPFSRDAVAGEGSLTFWAWNRGKRSVVLDLETDEGRRELADLARRCDVIVESGAAPVDLDALRRSNPRLVTVSISAFGSSGPKSAWPATDLTVMAAGGQLVLTGDADRAPVRTSVPQAFLHAAADAVGGAMVALAEREASGRGQHVDVSAQRSVLLATQSHVLAAPYRAPLVHRMSGGHIIAGIDIQLVWPCSDGFAVVMMLFGSAFGPYTARLMVWLREMGLITADVAEDDWNSFGARLFSRRIPVDRYDQLKQAVGKLCASMTKDELLQEALRRRLLVAPIATTADLVSSEQFAVRNIWSEVVDEHVSLRPIKVTSGFVRLDGVAALESRAPRLGEHDVASVAAAWQPPVGSEPQEHERERVAALRGLRVLDLTWALAGPATARFLSDFGATVVHVESSKRVDSARTVQPFLDDRSAAENAAVYHNMNAGKLSLSLDLSCRAGRGVLDDLIGWADVLIESFSPRGRISLGLDYERLRLMNPRLVMMSSCLFGQNGPLAEFAGFGNMAAGLTGFFDLTGWPDRPPAGPYSAYTDYLAPRFAVVAILRSLQERMSTGRGQYIDFAQAEAALQFLTPALLAATVNRETVTRAGNDDAVMAPHGVYPCAGDDRWIAVACRNDGDWRHLAELIGSTELVGMTASQRRERRTDLDALVSSWTRGRSRFEAQAALIAVGVPAHAVQHSDDCWEDPQLHHLRHFLDVEHPHHGTVTIENARVDLSETPSRLQRGAPSLGLHTMEVLSTLLGYDDERVGELYGSGALD